MGGCRCSYRNCTMRSNRSEQVHMFHFPVFDKPRCHQWITNAQKLNFLNLKVSQLKNRVICEHHFKDSDFMNYTKGKLKSDAVPTEDGPYCDSQIPKKEDDMLPINLEDIEYNDRLTLMEKRAHFPVKYGDFLINDVPEPIVFQITKSPSRLMKKDTLIDTYYDKISLNNYYDKLTFESSPVREPIPSLYKINITNPTEPKILKYEANKGSKLVERLPKTPSNSKNKVKIISEKKISEPVRLKGELQTVSPSIILKMPDKKNQKSVRVNDAQLETQFINIAIPPTSTNNVTILNNNNLATFQPVTEQVIFNDYPTANQLINLEDFNIQNIEVAPNIKTNLNDVDEINPVVNINEVSSISANIQMPEPTLSADMPDISMLRTDDQTFVHSVSTDMRTLPTERIKVEKTNRSENIKESSAKSSILKQKYDMSKGTQKITTTKKSQASQAPVSQTANKSVPKTKLPPEKLAEIVEKRKYNMKLKDIITSCINKLDDEPESTKISDNKKSNDKKVGEHLSSDSSLPSSQENIIAYFEARLQRMEDNLLNKIDQNAYRIMELKKTIKPSKTKKSTFTQTYTNLDTKKNLYQQISQYLTPEANSLIYEELFINQYSQKLNNSEPPKKRKRR